MQSLYFLVQSEKDFFTVFNSAGADEYTEGQGQGQVLVE